LYLLVDLSSGPKLNQIGSEHSLSEEEESDLVLPGRAPSLSRAGRNILGNTFTRIDRSGRIVKTKWDKEREREGLVQLDNDILLFENPLELSRRNIKGAVANVQAEQQEYRDIKTFEFFELPK